MQLTEHERIQAIKNLDERGKALMEAVEVFTHEDMARLWRFCPAGTIWFDPNHPACWAFAEKWARLGGMTPELSKKIGWRDE